MSVSGRSIAGWLSFAGGIVIGLYQAHETWEGPQPSESILKNPALQAVTTIGIYTAAAGATQMVFKQLIPTLSLMRSGLCFTASFALLAKVANADKLGSDLADRILEAVSLNLAIGSFILATFSLGASVKYSLLFAANKEFRILFSPSTSS